MATQVCLEVLEVLELKVREWILLSSGDTRTQMGLNICSGFAGLGGAPGLDGLNGLAGPKGLPGTPGTVFIMHTKILIETLTFQQQLNE